MAYINDTPRCETRTTKGSRCKHQAKYYRRHTDGKEYLVCTQHLKDRWFIPYQKEG